MNTFGKSDDTAQYIVYLCTTPKIATSCALVHRSFTRKARGTFCVRNWTNPRSDGTPISRTGQTPDFTAPPIQGAGKNTDVITRNRRSVKFLFLSRIEILQPINILWAFREIFYNVCCEQSELDAVGYKKRLRKWVVTRLHYTPMPRNIHAYSNRHSYEVNRHIFERYIMRPAFSGSVMKRSLHVHGEVHIVNGIVFRIILKRSSG